MIALGAGTVYLASSVRRADETNRRATETAVGLQRVPMESTKTEASMDSNKDRAEGAGHQVKGTIKEKVGQITNDPEMEGEGTGEKIGGKIQKKVGDLEKKIGR